MWHMDGWGYGAMGVGMLFMLLFWVLVVLGIVALVKWLAGTRRETSEHPVDIVRARYAKGEITREQYEQLKRDLE